MSGIGDALSELKSLPDDALQRELASPTGMLPPYLVLGEMHERKSVRAGKAPSALRPKSLADEYIGDVRKYMPSVHSSSPPGGMPAMPPPAPGGGGISSLNQTPPTRGFARGGIVSLDNNFRQRLIETANAVGADPLDLATAISYETGGTFNPTQGGPTTKWGKHRGLIQFGEPQAEQYGVDWSDPVNSQLGANGAVAKYLRGSGFKPGMSGMDLYSTINAGAPGKYGASDTAAGGAPGDVADKWNNQMAGHRAKAEALLGDDYAVDAATQQATMDAATQEVAAAPVADTGGGIGDYLILSQMFGGQKQQAAPPPAAAPQQPVKPFNPGEYLQDPEFFRRRYG